MQRLLFDKEKFTRGRALREGKKLAKQIHGITRVMPAPGKLPTKLQIARAVTKKTKVKIIKPRITVPR